MQTKPFHLLKNVIKNSPLCCTHEVCFKIQTLFTIKHNIKYIQ